MTGLAVNAQKLPTGRLNPGSHTVGSPADTVGAGAILIVPIPNDKRTCKGEKTSYLLVKKPQAAPGLVTRTRQQTPLQNSFLKVHGNILYDVDYRSRIDTPYAENNVYQHTVQTYLDITVKDHYPMRLYLTTRFSNSAYFPDFTDVNFQLNHPDFSRQVKEQIKNKLLERLALKDTSVLHALLKKNLKDLYDLENWVKDPSIFQKMVEEREHALVLQKRRAAQKAADSTTGESLPGTTVAIRGLSQLKAAAKSAEEKKDSLTVGQGSGKKDTTAVSRLDSLKKVEESMADKYQHALKLLDTLKGRVSDLKQQYEKQQQQDNAAGSRADIDNIETVPQLKAKLQSLKIADTVLPKGYKTLFALKSFGIGRNVLDYSALTARNISVTGVQVEYNPSWYAAFASGIVDYRFRDFVVQTSGPRQYATVLRYGRGMKEGNHLIFSYYFGRRQLYNSATSTLAATGPNYNLVGYSLEGQYKLNKTTFLVGEIAKSSLPYYNSATNKGTLLSQAVTFNDHSNMAWRVQLQSYIPATFTRITGSYQYAGSNFQSFSVFTTGAAQTNWMARIEQPFFNRHLNVVASIRTNDYVNPYIGYSFSGNTVFKSIQATLRLKNWPTLSVGYYPSSQLTKLSDTQYYENQFYTLVGTMNHFYRWRQWSMNTTLVYSRFYNRATDSNFVYFNTRNWLLSQNIFVNRFTWLINLSESANTDYTLYGAEGGLRYKVKKWLSLQGGLKYNHQTVYNCVVWGYSGGATVKVPRLGEIQFTADKGFIPGGNKQLVPNNTGRVSYFKIF